MTRLIAKEFRQLMPIGALWLAVLLLGYTMQFFTERIDEETFSSWCEGYCDYAGNTAVAFFSVLLALVTAYSLFPREHDDATIDFLRSLPVSRRALFLSKVIAAWLLLVAINLLSYLIDALLLASNPESIGGVFYSQVWLTLLWRDCLFAFIVLSHGVFLSWFRTLGLVIYAVYLLGLMWAESALGSSGVWSIFSLLSNEYQGSDLIVNSRALFIHTIVAFVLLVLAYRLWDRTESSNAGGKDFSKASKLLQLVLSFFGFLVVVAVLVNQVGVGTGTAQGDVQKVIATEHYRFFYTDSQSDVVEYIASHAESDLAMLGELLNVEELPSMRVDLSAQSEHAAGLAKWKKILMDLNAFDSDVSQRRVLSHETTHVLQAVESDRAMAEYYSATKFFIEGMAQYTSFEVVPEEGRRRSNWELASVSWKRQRIQFGDLINDNLFAERFDQELHYSLGDLWTKAMVDTCGVDSLGDFIRATGRKDAVKDLPAGIFWRDTTREIGCDLDTVNITWSAQMQSLYDSVDIADYPEFSDVAINRDSATGQISITAKLVPATVSSALSRTDDENPQSNAASINSTAETYFQMPDRFIVRIGRISTQISAGVDPVYRGQIKEAGEEQYVEFLVPDSAVSGTRFRYQLGYTPSVDARYYYETWRRGTALSAGEP